MKHYIVVETNITDPSWVSSYLEKVTPMLQKYGGRYIARSSQSEVLEGLEDAPQVSVLAEFPSKEAALAFYESDEYQPYKEARQAGSGSRFLLVPAEGVSA